MEREGECTWISSQQHTVPMGSQTLDLSNFDLLEQPNIVPKLLKLPKWDWVEGRYTESIFWAEWRNAIGCTTFLLEGRTVETGLENYFSRWGFEIFF